MRLFTCAHSKITRRQRLLAIIGVLLLVAATRTLRLDDYAMHPDEVWSVWQTLGTPEQILRWTPYDWPPLYYLSLGGWRSLVGMHPVALRFLSALAFMLGTAAMYRSMRRLQGHSAGVSAALAYSALAYGILISIEVRGYSLLMGLFPFTFWFMLRFFDPQRLIWRRAVPLGLVFAAMFYISLTSFGAFFVLGLYSLIVYPRRSRRWFVPGVIAGILAAPEIMSKAQGAVERVAATQTLTLPSLFPALADLLGRYTGHVMVIWVALLILTIALIIMRRQALRPAILALLIWVLILPVALYLLNPLLGFFSARYAWWMMPGIALLVGLGLSYLPRAGLLFAGLVLAASAFYPLPVTGEFNIWSSRSQLGRNFAWLRDHMIPGDVFLLDPNNDCGKNEEWDYYLRLYFPAGLPFIQPEQIDAHRRIWHVIYTGQHNSQIERQLRTQHRVGEFVGPAVCLFQLYEAPPDREGVLFENGMRFHGAELIRDGQPWSAPFTLHEGENLRLRLWWSADQPPELDYSVGLFVLRESTQRTTAELNSAPQTQPPETSRWIPGQLYVEEREILLPNTGNGQYGVYLTVYFWEDQRRLAAPGLNDLGLLPILRFPVMSY